MTSFFGFFFFFKDPGTTGSYTLRIVGGFRCVKGKVSALRSVIAEDGKSAVSELPAGGTRCSGAGGVSDTMDHAAGWPL